MKLSVEKIKELQTKLKEFGFYKMRVDGDYGIKTKLAMASFQRLYPPLIPDGIYGPKTEAAMFPVINERNNPLFKSVVSKEKYPHESDCEKFYGKVGKNQKRIKLPYPMRIAWDTSKSVRTMLCHEKVADDMLAIFEDILEYYGLDQIKLLGLDMYGGCLNVRKIRGGNRWSTHAWGISVDIDPSHNQLRWGSDKARLARDEYKPFWDIVEKHGAYSLGKNHGYDWMHFQFCHR